MAHREQELRCLDIHAPLAGVQVIVSQSRGSAKERTLWVNIDGLCRLRVSGIEKGQLTIDDPERGEWP